MTTAATSANVLVIDYVLFAKDVAAELAARGFTVHWLSPRKLSVATFETACRTHQPRFLFSINFSPELALLCSRQQLPYLSWTIDPLPAQRFTLYPGTDPAACHVFCHQRTMVTRFQELGLQKARFLPLAAPDRRQPVLDPALLEPWRCPISFVGQSLTKEKQAAKDALTAATGNAAVLAPTEDWLRSLALGAADSAAFMGLAANPDQLPAFLTELAQSGRLEQAQLLDLLDGWLAHEVRSARIRALAAHGVHVYGDEGWRGVAADYRGFAHHQQQLNCVYTASAANLDLPRVYQRDIVTMRVFDIMACGGVILSEWQPDLAAWFTPDQHLFTYRNTPEMLAAATRLQTLSPTHLQALGQAARQTVLNHHRITHRINTLLQALP